MDENETEGEVGSEIKEEAEVIHAADDDHIIQEQNAQEENEKRGKTYRAGEMVTESREELYKNMKYPTEVGNKISEMIDSGIIALDETEGFVFIRLKNLNEKYSIQALEAFEQIKKTGIIEKPSAFLANIIAAHQGAQDNEISGTEPIESPFFVPENENILKCKNKYGMELTVSTGQRKLDLIETGNELPAASECFIGSIQRGALEPEIMELLSQVDAKVHDLRLMMGYDGKSRGFAFATFMEEDGCQKCKDKLDSYQFEGKKLVVNISTPATRIFVGSVPKDKTKEEFETEFRRIGVTNFKEIIVHEPQTKIPGQINRGFIFVDFPTHIEAAEFKKQISQQRSIQPFGKIMPNVDWAEPIEKVDEAAMAKVKNLYVVGWLESRTEEQIKELFAPFGTVEKVRKINNYSFVHFAQRSEALNAIENMNNKQISPGEKITATIAKPLDQGSNRNNRRKHNQGWGNQGGWGNGGHGNGYGGGQAGHGGGGGWGNGGGGWGGGNNGGNNWGNNDGYHGFGGHRQRGGPRPKRARF